MSKEVLVFTTQNAVDSTLANIRVDKTLVFRSLLLIALVIF